MAHVMTADYTALFNRMHPDPATLTPGQRRNKKYATPEEVLALLRTLNSEAYRGNKKAHTDRHSKSYFATYNNGLIRFERYTWIDGAGPYARHTLTSKGLHYLRWLEAHLAPKVARKVCPDCGKHDLVATDPFLMRHDTGEHFLCSYNIDWECPDIWCGGCEAECVDDHTWIEKYPSPTQPIRALTVQPCMALIPYGYDARFDVLAHWMEDALWREWCGDIRNQIEVCF
jgi:hypothetical protein